MLYENSLLKDKNYLHWGMKKSLWLTDFLAYTEMELYFYAFTKENKTWLEIQLIWGDGKFYKIFRMGAFCFVLRHTQNMGRLGEVLAESRLSYINIVLHPVLGFSVLVSVAGSFRSPSFWSSEFCSNSIHVKCLSFSLSPPPRGSLKERQSQFKYDPQWSEIWNPCPNIELSPPRFRRFLKVRNTVAPLEHNRLERLLWKCFQLYRQSKPGQSHGTFLEPVCPT